MKYTNEILDMICDRNMIDNLMWEAKSRARALECNVYVYYRPEWCSAIVTTEYKGEGNLFFEISV